MAGQVLAAQDLPNEDVTLGGTLGLGGQAGSDPYVILDTARQEFITTKTINNTQTPVRSCAAAVHVAAFVSLVAPNCHSWVYCLQ